MHFTDPAYRIPHWLTQQLLELTRGRTRNHRKLCNVQGRALWHDAGKQTL